MNWKPGDRAIVAFHTSGEFIGRSCTVDVVGFNVNVMHNDRSIETWPVCIGILVDGFPPLPLGSFDIYGQLFTFEWRSYACKPEWLRRPDNDADIERLMHERFIDQQLTTNLVELVSWVNSG